MNVKVMPQLVAGASDAPHCFCKEKSDAFGPDTLTPLRARGTFPELLKANDWGGLLLPTTWLAKLTLEVESDATGSVPVPVSATDCGLSLALSVIFTVPAIIPTAAGEKVTESVQLAPAPSEAGQLLATEKSPVASMLLIWRGAFPELLKVKVCAELAVFTFWLRKERLEVERPATGLATPVPVKLTSCEPGGALSTKVRTPWRVPGPEGAKVTATLHCPPTGRPGVQLSASVKSPLTLTLWTPSGADPLLVSCTFAATLLVPTFCGEKVKLEAETEAAGSPIPVPWRGTFCEPP